MFSIRLFKIIFKWVAIMLPNVFESYLHWLMPVFSKAVNVWGFMTPLVLKLLRIS